MSCGAETMSSAGKTGTARRSWVGNVEEFTMKTRKMWMVAGTVAALGVGGAVAVPALAGDDGAPTTSVPTEPPGPTSGTDTGAEVRDSVDATIASATSAPSASTAASAASAASPASANTATSAASANTPASPASADSPASAASAASPASADSASSAD